MAPVSFEVHPLAFYKQLNLDDLFDDDEEVFDQEDPSRSMAFVSLEPIEKEESVESKCATCTTSSTSFSSSTGSSSSSSRLLLGAKARRLTIDETSDEEDVEEQIDIDMGIASSPGRSTAEETAVASSKQDERRRRQSISRSEEIFKSLEDIVLTRKIDTKEEADTKELTNDGKELSVTQVFRNSDKRRESLNNSLRSFANSAA